MSDVPISRSRPESRWKNDLFSVIEFRYDYQREHAALASPVKELEWAWVLLEAREVSLRVRSGQAFHPFEFPLLSAGMECYTDPTTLLPVIRLDRMAEIIILEDTKLHDLVGPWKMKMAVIRERELTAKLLVKSSSSHAEALVALASMWGLEESVNQDSESDA